MNKEPSSEDEYLGDIRMGDLIRIDGIWYDLNQPIENGNENMRDRSEHNKKC